MDERLRNKNMNEKEPGIRLLICYHKPSQLFQDEILTPIHVGRALAQKRMDPKSEEYRWLTENMIGDDTGENISEKNRSYNEMTALYWAWKNYEKLGNPDYIGLMHYRRHFVLHEGEIDVIPFENMGEHYLEEIGYSPEALRKLVQGCDFVTHLGKVNHVYRHYVENHRKEDLDLAFEILYEKHPEYRETAEEYFAGDISSFCNMFIFRREIFFDYCQWIFEILEEFERRVDLSEKRLFISERLTGVYIAKLMQDQSLTYKVLPISFVSEPVTVPLVLSLDEENPFALAVTLTSMLVNKKPESRYEIYLLTGSRTEEGLKKKFEYFPNKYENTSLQFLETDLQREYYPLAVSQLLPQVNKCLYLEESTLILGDLSEFYRTCSVDDFWAVGAPLGKYDEESTHKKVDSSFLVINCARFRSHQVLQSAMTGIRGGRDGEKLLNEILQGQIGYVPWYLMTLGAQTASGSLFDRGKTRGSYQADALWKPILFYGDNLPWENPQGTFANFWWDMAEKVPALFPFVSWSLGALETQFERDQKEINRAAFASTQLAVPVSEEAGESGQTAAVSPAPEKGWEEWRSYSFMGKLKFYYRHNGAKQTVRYAFQKLRGGK